MIALRVLSTSAEPEGQRAFTNPGACWRPVTSAWALAEAAIVAVKAGAPMKANPATRAERTSPNAMVVDLTGFTAVTIGVMLREVLVVANWIALYQSLKNALTSVIVSKIFKKEHGLEAENCHILKIVLRTYRTCAWMLGSRSDARAPL